MVVIVETAITQAIKDGYLLPKSPLFLFYNDGTSNVYINGLQLLPGQDWGVNNDALVANFIDKGVEVINKTQYEMHFVALPGQVNSLQLIETIIKYQGK